MMILYKLTLYNCISILSFAAILVYYTYYLEFSKSQIILTNCNLLHEMPLFSISYIVYFHYFTSICLSLALLLTMDIHLFLINAILFSIIVYTNLYYKGCMLWKFEKTYNALYGSNANNIVDYIFKHIGVQFTLHERIMLVFGAGLLIYVIMLIKLIYIYTRHNAVCSI